MDTNHLFTGGLHQDADPQFQPENTLRYAENWVLTPTGHLLQEKGTRPIGGPNKQVVGATALNGQEILFSTNGAVSEIGYLDGNTYTPVLASNQFSLSYPVRSTAKVDYRGHRLVYWGDNYSFRWLDLDAPTTNIPAGLDVIANPLAPTVSVASVQVGGSLPTGIYQASATLLTASKNETGYGLFTGVTPILNEDPLTSARQLLDGAPSQTPSSGSITFHLTNLDPTYRYVQLVVATYTGIGNSLELFKLPLIALNGRTSLDYTYYAFSQHEGQLTLDEVLGQLPDYVAAKEVLQKDGHLLAAGLTTAPDEDIDWQAIANNVVLGPAIKEVAFSEDVTITRYVEGTSTFSQDTAALSYSKDDYKNPLLTENGKSLQRGEVYSFCLVPIVKGRRQDAYHIPASLSNSQAFAAYTSLEQYPLTGSYPTGGIRHHQMPDLLAEPLLGNGTIRILGVQEVVKPDFSGLTSSQQASITGYLIGMQVRDTANRSILAQGILNPLQLSFEQYCYYVSPFSGKPTFRLDDDGGGDFGVLSKEYAAFYSPETSILGNPTTTATSLNAVGTLSGTSYGVADKRSGGLGEEFAAIFYNYSGLASTTPVATPLLPAVTSTVAPQTAVGTFITGERYPISTTSQNGYTLLKANLNTSTGFAYQGTADVQFQYSNNATSSLRFLQSDNTRPNGDDANWKGVSTRTLYNLVASRPRQYGALEQATYFPVLSTTPSAPPASFFQGDTFISKVALISATQEYTDREPGIGYVTLSYFFCESTVNTNYRHYIPAVGDTLGTLPYYPKSRTLWIADGSGVMQYPTGLGQASGYNKQYSFTNTLTPLFPRDRTIEYVSSYPNRILYSAQAVEGEQLDAYRSFKANDYHDVPKDKGAITSLAVVGNSLYTHTTGCLYKEAFNNTSTQLSSEGEVTLGNGGLFDRPSTPILTIEGGYAGCQDAPAAITTPSGHFFPDAIRGKVFLLGEGLSEISSKGLFQYFQDTLKTGNSYKASYDYQQERYILTGNNVPSISYSTRASNGQGAWLSFHGYFPSYLFSTPQRQLLMANNQVGILNEGTVSSSSISLITNTEPDASKWFATANLHSSRPPSLLACFTQQQATGGYQLTPYITYGQDPNLGEVLYREANDQYQLSLPRDNEGGRLQGKWLQQTYTFATGIFPTLLRLLTTSFNARYR